ncbi:hypothetical protein CDCA_CDCA20G4867 [Cyanidium caldarium]|uniref:protein disulfide-isomerase n=1 Tax=Cyanidium caldarium TaxID=2771 RepID=A0AAV9J2P7_CYACA|nr:hypothetical protein CDCA_CDCA20G4867 [Cyanidium caldarium]
MRLATIFRRPLLLILLLLGVLRVGAAATSSGTSVALTDETFDAHVCSQPLALIKFIAPWCGHCKRMKADWDAAAKALAGRDGVLLAEVDATTETKLRDRYGVRGFPTIKLFVSGEPVADYNGDRSTASLVSFVERQLSPPVHEVRTAAAAERWTQAEAASAPRVVLALTDSKLDAAKRSALRTTLEGVARQLRETLTNVTFLVAEQAEVLKALGADASADGTAVLVLRAADDVAAGRERIARLPLDTVALGKAGKKAAAMKPELERLADQVTQFVRRQAAPLVGEISQATASLYEELGKPLFILFDPSPAAPEPRGRQLMRQLAAKYHERLSFVMADDAALGQFRKYVGCSGSKRFALHVLGQDVNFAYDGEEDEPAMAAFLEQYLSGELKPTLRSEEPPADNTGAVRVVVGKTWESIVMDPGKDVLVEQYAPWCGHCRKLEPAYEELARQLAHVPTLVIAKMDATVNDAPGEHKARGFPTILFFPAGADKKAVRYEGDRSVADMAAFLRKHATHKFTIGGGGDGASAAGAKDEL